MDLSRQRSMDSTYHRNGILCKRDVPTLPSWFKVSIERHDALGTNFTDYNSLRIVTYRTVTHDILPQSLQVTTSSGRC